MHYGIEEEILPNFSTVAYVDMDVKTNIIYAARIRSSPFSVIAFEHYEMKSHDMSSGDDIDGIGWVMQHVTRWRELDNNSAVLVPEHVSMMPWSQMFMCFARRFKEREIVSMCGPVSNKYYLQPMDSHVKLFKTSSDELIAAKLQKIPLDPISKKTVPLTDLWDWQTVLIITHLYCWHEFCITREPSGRDILLF